jgi:SAM-dependent methyltransferase
MSIQESQNKFGKERAERYKNCMDRCPTARYLEILPLLCLVSGRELESADMLDIGSGTGYLADFFEGIAKSVLRVDQSEEMLKKSGSLNYLVADMADVSNEVGYEKADLITCLAAFHHCHKPENPETGVSFTQAETRHFSPERHLDIKASLALQYRAIKDWVATLRPGGVLCLIDIPGYPDISWNPFWQNRERHKIDLHGYFDAAADNLANWKITASASMLERLFSTGWSRFYQTDPHMNTIRSLIDHPFSMKELTDTYLIAENVINKAGPMVPADFFDDIVDGYGAQRHFGFFMRETSIRDAMLSAGMKDVHVSTLPTPWFFKNRKETAWFVHELFGLGEKWDYENIPDQELNDLLKWLDHYLGFYQDSYGRTMLYWQLCYCYGIKAL